MELTPKLDDVSIVEAVDEKGEVPKVEDGMEVVLEQNTKGIDGVTAIDASKESTSAGGGGGVEIGVLAKGELDFKSLSFLTLVFPVFASEIVGVVEVADQKLKTGAGTDEGITGVGVEVEKISAGVGVVVDITVVVVSVLSILVEETYEELKLKSELVVVPNENIPFVGAVEARASKFPHTFAAF
nr:hypothetical protein [Tanacetum cinerariifolium]